MPGNTVAIRIRQYDVKTKPSHVEVRNRYREHTGTIIMPMMFSFKHNLSNVGQVVTVWLVSARVGMTHARRDQASK